MAEEKTKLKKYWAEQAVSLALQGRWAEAVTANQNILSLFPSDAEAHNRLGKAYTELGRYAEAVESYQHALQIDPGNIIAEKNLQRLSNLIGVDPGGTTELSPTSERLEPRLFIEELGKTGTTVLINTAAPSVLARMSSGDLVRLRPEGRTLVVENLRSERLGDVEPKLGQRLITFMQAGNRYTAAIASLQNGVRIIIRETFQHPSMIGRISFPAKTDDKSFRSYIKDSVLKYDLDEEEEEETPEGREFVAEVETAGEEISDEGDALDDDLGGDGSDDK